MAKMFPEKFGTGDKQPDGNKAVFEFIENSARPHEEFCCWYRPEVEDIEGTTDFLLFGNNIGMLVIKVKEWLPEQIVAATPHKFMVRFPDRVVEKLSPDREARAFMNLLVGKLEKVPSFLSDHPPHRGRLKIPVGRIVVFPHIGREDYIEKGIQWFIPFERVLVKEDIEREGGIFRDRSGRRFIERVSGAVPFRVQGLSEDDIDRLLTLIKDDSRIVLPSRRGSGKSRFKTGVMSFDKEQEKAALYLKQGHQIIKGPPGSGKTLILVSRCCHLYRYHHKMKRILLVCYNIALVSYLKMLVHEKRFTTGSGGIHVCHFFELCARILKKPVRYENEDAEYYDMILSEVKEKVARDKGGIEPFDAVIIDEGQDFSNEMLQLLLSLTKKEGDFIISLDTHQDVYRRKGSWKSLGIKARGRTRHLETVYRNTVEIADFGRLFIDGNLKKNDKPAMLPFNFDFHGEYPKLLRFQDDKQIESFVVQDIGKIISTGEFKRSEIAVIYDDKIYGNHAFAYDNRALPMRILRELENAGMPVKWVSRDVQAKEAFDPRENSISLISIHSSKGLDFDMVYLLGVDRIRPTKKTGKNLVNLIYVAITRAKYRLLVPYLEESELILRMKKCVDLLNGR